MCVFEPWLHLDARAIAKLTRILHEYAALFAVQGKAVCALSG